MENSKTGKKHDNHITLHAFYTVEASLILPLILFLFAALIIITFFLYNRCVASQEAYLASFRPCVREHIGKYDFSIAESKKTEEAVYIGGAEKGITLVVKNKVHTATLRGSMKALAVSVFLPGDELSFSAEGKSFCVDPVENIRTCRLIKKVTGTKKGIK